MTSNEDVPESDMQDDRYHSPLEMNEQAFRKALEKIGPSSHKLDKRANYDRAPHKAADPGQKRRRFVQDGEVKVEHFPARVGTNRSVNRQVGPPLVLGDNARKLGEDVQAVRDMQEKSDRRLQACLHTIHNLQIQAEQYKEDLLSLKDKFWKLNQDMAMLQQRLGDEVTPLESGKCATEKSHPSTSVAEAQQPVKWWKD